MSIWPTDISVPPVTIACIALTSVVLDHVCGTNRRRVGCQADQQHSNGLLALRPDAHATTTAAAAAAAEDAVADATQIWSVAGTTWSH